MVGRCTKGKQEQRCGGARDASEREMERWGAEEPRPGPFLRRGRNAGSGEVGAGVAMDEGSMSSGRRPSAGEEAVEAG